MTNLDYLSFGSEGETTINSHPVKPEPTPTDWEKLIGSLDNGQTNIYDACYGGPPVNALLDVPSLGMHHNNHSANAVHDVAWDGDLWALTTTSTNTSNNSVLTTNSGHPESIVSFSTEEGNLSGSNEDFTNLHWDNSSITNVTGASNDAYRAIVMPDLSHHDDLNFDGSGWDAALNL